MNTTTNLRQRCVLHRKQNPTYDLYSSKGYLLLLLKTALSLQEILAETFLRSHKLVLEMRSLFARIQIPPDRYGWMTEIGPARWLNEKENPALDKCLRARTEGIQEMLAKWPCATPVDVQIFLEGWKRGEAWALVKGNTLNYDNTKRGVGSSYIFFFPKEYWKLRPVKQFMRLSFAPVWSAIQSLLRLTKRDRPAQLP